MSDASDRIETLIELAPRYEKAHDKVYKTPGHRASRTCPDCQEFDLVSGDVEILLGCEDCGSGGIEDAQYVRDNPGNSDSYCEQCIEFATLWDIHEEELEPYTRSI